VLLKHRPHYALIFLKPEELDVNFAWQWLRLSATLDDDPFVDVRTGFITGETPRAAAEFVRRIRGVVEGRLRLPAALIDNLGPNPMAAPGDFQKHAGSFFLPIFNGSMQTASISHGVRGFSVERLTALDNAGILHFGGHGYPDRIVDGLNGPWVRRLKLAPCLVFNGACYSGVTGPWFDLTAGKLRRKTVTPDHSFCLGLLANQAIGCLAPLHPDHGIPVYQEMELPAGSNATLGDIIKHTHDGVILAAGTMPDFEELADNAPPPAWTPNEVMLKGTASRVLFGDPALSVGRPFAEPPFDVSMTAETGSLRIKAVLHNDVYRSTFTNTYCADLSDDPNLFNDCARFTCILPTGWEKVKTPPATEVSVAGKALKHRLVACAVEEDAGCRRLHVQIDIGCTGYMQSPLRKKGTTIFVTVQR
jgi:hypothetical protein